MCQLTKPVMMLSFGLSLWSGLVRAQHLEVKGNASVATGDQTAGLAVGIPPAERQAKVHIKANGNFYGENSDGTSQGSGLPLLLQSETDGTVFGALNSHKRQAFALNLEGDSGSTEARGFPVFYDKYDGTWRPSLYLQYGSVGISRKPQYRLDVNGEIRAVGWLRTEGSAGWYSQTYDGGWYMQDSTWVRSYKDKNVWTGNGVLGTNGGLIVGYGELSPPAGGAAFAGWVGIGTRLPALPLDVAGDIGVRGVDVVRLDGTNAYLFPWATGYSNHTVHVGGGAPTSLAVHGRISADEGIKVYKMAPHCDKAGEIKAGEITLTESCSACQSGWNWGGDPASGGNGYYCNSRVEVVPNVYLGKLVD